MSEERETMKVNQLDGSDSCRAICRPSRRNRLSYPNRGPQACLRARFDRSITIVSFHIPRDDEEEAPNRRQWCTGDFPTNKKGERNSNGTNTLDS